MITYTNKENLSLVVRSAYSTALILTLAGAPLALAQETNAPTTMKPIVVTGSYIPTAETVGPAPVQTVTAVEIEKVGAQDVLDLVKKVSTAFGGNVNVGQTVNNGGFPRCMGRKPSAASSTSSRKRTTTARKSVAVTASRPAEAMSPSSELQRCQGSQPRRGPL